MGRAYLELSVDHCALSEPAYVDAPEQRAIASFARYSPSLYLPFLEMSRSSRDLIRWFSRDFFLLVLVCYSIL